MPCRPHVGTGRKISRRFSISSPPDTRLRRKCEQSGRSFDRGLHYRPHRKGVRELRNANGSHSRPPAVIATAQYCRRVESDALVNIVQVVANTVRDLISIARIDGEVMSKHLCGAQQFCRRLQLPAVNILSASPCGSEAFRDGLMGPLHFCAASKKLTIAVSVLYFPPAL